MGAHKSAGGETAAFERRPTPRDPYPQPRPPSAGADERPRPVELGPDAIAVLEGRTFMFSDSLGDVAPGSVGGLVHEDTRFLSRWELRLDGAPLSLLKSEPVDYDSAAFFLTKATPICLGPALMGIRARSLISIMSAAAAKLASDARLSSSPPTGAVKTRSPSTVISSW